MDQSTPDVGPKYRVDPRNFWYRETLGRSNVSKLHHIRRFTVKTANSTKSGRGTAVVFIFE